MKVNGSLEIQGAGSEIKNAKIETVISLPTITANDAGRIVFNSTDNKFYFGTSTGWVSGLSANDFGGASAVTELSDIAYSDRDTAIGYKTLVLGASTFSKNSPNVTTNSSSYSRTNNVASVSFVVGTYHVPSVGDKFYISTTSRHDVNLLAKIKTISNSGTTYTITFDDARPDVAAAAVTGLDINFPNMAQNAHSWMTMLNASLGGSLDYVNLSRGGSTTSHYLNEDRFQEIKAKGPYDFGLVNFGMGNAINNNGTAQQVITDVIAACKKYAPLMKRGFLITDLGSINVAIDGSSSKFTVRSVVAEYLKRELTRQIPNFELIDVFPSAVQLTSYGNVDTAELLAGRPPAGLFDNSSVHYSPLGSEIVAKQISQYLLPHIKYAPNMISSFAENTFVNTVTDGTDGNPNGIPGWYGAVTAPPVTISGLGTIGSAPDGTTVAATFVNPNVTASIAVQDNPLGGKSTLLTVNDPNGSAGGIKVVWKYAGPTGAGILETLNNTSFRGVDLDLFAEFSLRGFNTDSLRYMEVSLIGESAAGTHVICSLIGDYGIETTVDTLTKWQHGFGGLLRSNSTFSIPARTYTAGYIKVEFKAMASSPLGSIKAKLSRMRLTKRKTV